MEHRDSLKAAAGNVSLAPKGTNCHELRPNALASSIPSLHKVARIVKNALVESH
jgi:hypothetical protein